MAEIPSLQLFNQMKCVTIWSQAER